MNTLENNQNKGNGYWKVVSRAHFWYNFLDTTFLTKIRPFSKERLCFFRDVEICMKYTCCRRLIAASLRMYSSILLYIIRSCKFVDENNSSLTLISSRLYVATEDDKMESRQRDGRCPSKNYVAKTRELEVKMGSCMKALVYKLNIMTLFFHSRNPFPSRWILRLL